MSENDGKSEFSKNYFFNVFLILQGDPDPYTPPLQPNRKKLLSNFFQNMLGYSCTMFYVQYGHRSTCIWHLNGPYTKKYVSNYILEYCTRITGIMG